MNKRIARVFSLLLAAVLLLTACNVQPGTTETTGGTTAGTEPAQHAGVPERGQPDKSDLLYSAAIDSYKKTDWSANWIWTKSSSDDSYVAFRKTVNLDADTQATAYISAVDKYTLWVNGEMVVLDGSLKRGPTPYDSYYDAVELDLKAGENVIALLVAFNGRSGDGSIVPVAQDEEGDDYNQAGLLFEMEAGGQTIVSDSSWKAIRHAAYKNRVTAGADYPGYDQSSMLAERNVYFAAADDIGPFMNAGYDDSAWEDATLVAKPGDLPFGDLYSAIIRPIKFAGITDFENSADYVGQTLTSDTVLELELPGNIQFTTYFELEAPAGKKLTFYTDSYTDQDGMANFKDTYVTKDGTQSYENLPWRSGSKLYIEAEAGVTFTALGYRKSEFNGTWAGSFTSSNPELDQLWQESLNTVAICMRDTFMDCPERERGPYMGDASNQIDAVLYGYDQGGYDMTKKAILACVGWTPSSGAIPSRAPSVKPQEIPNQSLAFMTSAYHYYLHSGDAETMRFYYTAFINYLKLFEMADGLPVYREGSWTWNDWGDRIDADLLQVGFYYYALSLTKSLAESLGIPDDLPFLTERMESIQGAYHDAYYTPEGFKSPNSKYIDDRANALLALSGLAGEEDCDLICQVIMNTYQASPFCEKYILEALCVMGREDLAVQRMLDRYGFMLTDDHDTLWEQFTTDTGTFNHGWSAAPMYILSKYVAGIRPIEAGFAAYEIAPSDLLESFSCTVYTPKGNITVVKEGNTLTVTAIDSPATVYLPASFGSAAVSGGEYTVTEDGSILLPGEGTYTFTAN